MSDNYQKAMSLLLTHPNEYSKGFVLLSKALANGDIRATYALATWYLHGTYVEKNIHKGTAMLKSAAEANIPAALFDLAVSYETGIGVSRSEVKAAQLYLRAALAGDIESFASVGRCLYYGIGFVKDRKQAAVWLEKAAESEMKEERRF